MVPSDTVNRAARNGSIPWTSPFAVVSVIALLVAAKLAVGAATDLVGDEAYYTLWSLYPLQAGYYDHPPAVVWFIEAGQFLLGETALASRLAAIAATIVCALAVWRTAIALFADRTIAALGALWFSLSLGVAVGLLIVTPDAPSLLFWTLAIWAAAELYRSRNANWWLVFGLFAGLGLQAKYTGLFLGAGIVLWLLAYEGNRRWFRLLAALCRRHSGVGRVLAGCPVEYRPRFRVPEIPAWPFDGSGARASARVAQYLPEFIAAQAGMLWPGLFLFAVAGFTLVLRRREFRRDPALGLLVTTAAPALVYFAWHAFHSRVQGNWTLPLFGQLALLGAWAAVTWLPSSDRARAVWLWLRRWQAPLALLLVAVLYAFVAFAPLRIPARLPTDEMAGWSELADETAAIAHKVGARAVYTPDYTLVGAMASYLRFGGDDLAVYPSAGLQHYTFMDVPEPGEIGGPVLYAVRARPDADIAPALRPFGVDAPHLSSAVRNGPGGRPAERIDFYLVSGR
jgi:4-amino-4-deoxy-L-arabinose transferase-like glycosyltransferase